MMTLSPEQAAAIAQGAYLMRESAIGDFAVNSRDKFLGCANIFQTVDTSRFQGRSGASRYRPLSGFGYIAEGIGEFEKHILCATRGTETLADWLTDGNVGMQSGPSGLQVHIGFNQTWKSYIDEVRTFLRGKHPAHIHCVGHSLGGALAMLNADYFTATKAADGVSVYTFGAPRVGGHSFVTNLTRQIGVDSGSKVSRVFRVSHVADPVPMIPTFPFLHAPHAAPSYVLGDGLLSFAAHKMAKSYQPRVAGLTWDTFPNDATQISDDKVEAWLTSASGAGAIKMYSANALHMIGLALKWLLKKAGLLVGAVISAGTVAFTLLDRISWMLEKCAQLNSELDFYTTQFILATMRFLGRTVNAAQQLTRAYLRWVFDLLFSAINGAASLALAVANRAE